MKVNFTRKLSVSFFAFNKLALQRLLFVTTLGISVCSYAQPTVLGTQVVNGGYTTYNLNTVGGFKQIKLLATSSNGAGTRNWEFVTGTAAAPVYTTNWRPYSGSCNGNADVQIAGYNTFIAPNVAFPAVTATATYNTSSGGCSGFLPAVTSGNYYTFNVTNTAAANNNMSVLETAYNPETISTVTQYPAATAVVNTAGVTVTITASAAPNANVFVRYSTDNWVTSTLVLASFAGTTGTAVIPAQTTGTTVRYYVYNSPKTKAAIDADVTGNGQSAHDMATLNVNNNSNANYSYTVLAGVVNVASTGLPANDASYPTLATAFTQINNGLHTGVITITITGNTTETATATLNASGTGSASYTSISVQPSGGAARTVSGAITAGLPLIDFNGADNVTIDGLNSGGNSLTISNTTASATMLTCTIRFVNGATINTITNCTIEGSTTAFSNNEGVIFFYNGASNSSNTISNNTIKPAGSNLPGNAISSNGPAAGNSSNTISGNKIQDYFVGTTGGPSNGIYLSNNNNAWTITGNRFFQTSARVSSAGVTHRGIFITSGGGYTISDNIIGYGSSTGTGTTQHSGSSQKFLGMDLGFTAGAAVSSIQNNEIAGIVLSTSSNATANGGIFSGIYVSSGSVNIGTITANKIGIISTGPISITSSNNGGGINGINVASANTVNIQNNIITGISTSSSTANGYVFNGITTSGTGGFTISSNTIGGASANSITIGTTGGATPTTSICTVSGINNTATGTVTIGSSGAANTINNLTLFTTSTNVATALYGIINTSTGGAATIAFNNISNLSASNLNIAGVQNASTSSSAININNNTINTISNSSGSANATAAGISNTAAATTTNIFKNKIYDISVSGASAVVNGISLAAGTTVTVHNNIIGDLRAAASANTSAVNGINISSAAATTSYNVYYNTIYLTAAGAAGAGSSGIYHAGNATGTTAALSLRNNIIVNLSTPGSGGFTVAFRRTNTNLANYAAASNNNLLYAGPPSASRLIYYDGTNSYQTITAYKAMTVPATLAPRDAASVSSLPSFLNSSTGSLANYLHNDPSVASVVESGAVNIGGFTNDYDADTRQGNAGYTGTGTAPDIGADEFEGISCVGATPALTAISVSTPGPYYAGDVITITGTNLSGITYASINNINVSASISNLSAGSVDLTIPVTLSDSTASVIVANGIACSYSNSLSFTFSGYITKGSGTGTGNWSVASIWRNNAKPVANGPVIINTGDAVNFDETIDPCKLTINSTASLTHQNNSFILGTTNLNVTNINGTLTIDDAVTPILNSAGRFISKNVVVFNAATFNNNSANAAAVSGVLNFYVNSGANYNHNAVGSVANGATTDFPGTTTRTFGATSNVVITKWANAGTPVNLPASGLPGWGNLTINISASAPYAFAGDWNQKGLLTNVQGNMLVLSTGNKILRLNSGDVTPLTVTVTGNLTVSGGTFYCFNGSGFTNALNVTGNFKADGTGTLFRLSGGTITAATMTVTGTSTIDGTAVFDNQGTSGNATTPGVTMNFASLDVKAGTFAPSTSSSTFTVVNVTGALTVTGGTVTNGSNVTYKYNIGSINVSSGLFNPCGTTSSNFDFIMAVTGDFTVSGTGSFSSSSVNHVRITVGGNYSQSSSSATAFRFQNVPAVTDASSIIYKLDIGGNFSITNGTFIGGSNLSPANINFTGGVLSSVTYTQNGGAIILCSGSSGKTNLNVKTGKTLSLLTNLNPGSTAATNRWSVIAETGSILDCGITPDVGVANAFTTFTLQTGATLRTGHTGGVYNSTAGAGSITTALANTSLNAGATYEFNGTSPQVSSVFTTTPAATPSNVANMIINNTAGVTLTASYNVTTALQMNGTAGNLTLSTFNLTTASITTSGAGFSNTKMVVTDNTGALGQPVSLATILFPVGNSGNYTPASYTFTVNSTARYLNVRAVTPRNVNDVSTTNYINNRWWNTDLSVTTGNYTYTSSYTYISGDVVGSAAAIHLNRWNGSAWIDDAGSSVNTGTLTLNSGSLNQTTGTLSATAQWVGRAYVAPALYHWINPAGGSWLVSSNWSPTGVPGSGDGVIFDVAGGATYITTNMPAGISLTQFTVSTANNVTFNAGAAGTVSLLYPGTTAPQFSIAAGSSMTIEGTNVINFTLPANATGNVAGSLSLQKVAHTVTAATAGALVFPSGGYFSAGIIPATGFSGNPFGATGTNGSVIFQNGSICETFEGSNPFGNPGVSISTFQGGSLFRYSDPNNAASPSLAGRTYANFEYNANKLSGFVSLPFNTAFVCDTLTVSVNSITIDAYGTPGHSIKGNINVKTGATLIMRATTSAGTINLNSGATQVIYGGGTFNVDAAQTLNIVSATTVSLQKNMNVVGTGNIAVNGTLICTGENYVASTGTLNVNSGGTLSVQSVDGVGTGGTNGNVRCTGFPNIAGGNYTYSGSSNQVTGGRLHTTLSSPGVLTIANTGAAGNNIVTLSNNNTTVPRINLNAGQFNAGTGGTLIINGGTNIVSGGGGNQYLAGASTDNIIRFATNGAVSGTPELYNVTIGTSGTGVDFQNNARINGILLINSGGFVVNNPPKYNTGSYLIYNSGGAYNRNIEWGNNSGFGTAGYPHHVTVQNSTTLNFLNTTTFDVGCGGDFNLGTTTAGTLVLSNYQQPYDLFVKGNINIGGSSAAGTFTMSDNIGCDLFLTGNWTRNANGVVNFGGGNGRSVYFEGATDAAITASGGQTFPYVRVQKATTATKVTLNDDVRIIYEITFTKGTFDLANKNTTIISTAANTGRVAESDAANTVLSYSGTGKFIIERNVADLRSWRLLTAPVVTSQTIRESWMEGAFASTTSPLYNQDPVPGYGMHISGPVVDSFDQTPLNNYSIKYHNGSNWVGTGILPKTTGISSKPGWMTFIRGPRSYPISTTTSGTTPVATTLRTSGQIYIGTQPAITPLGATVVGNPYASAVDFSSVTKSPSGFANDIYYLWDPKINSGTSGQAVGGWITCTRKPSGTGYAMVPAPASNTIDSLTGRIESGAAIMVKQANITSLNFKESDKSALNALVFRPVRSQSFSSTLRTNLYVKNNDGSTGILDGVMNIFDKDYSTAVDGADAEKLINTAENFGITVNGKLLAIDKRDILNENDTIFYEFTQVKVRNYVLQFAAEKMTHNNLVGYLEDKFLNTKTRLNPNGITKIEFNANRESPGSYAKDRFRVVFRHAVKYNHVKATVLNSDIVVNWDVSDELDIMRYEIERSSDGKLFSSIGVHPSKGTSAVPVSYNMLDEKPAPGEYWYRIKTVTGYGMEVYSEAVKVKIVRSSDELYVFPNPVTNNSIQLQLDKNAPAGKYNTRLLSASGQLINSQQLIHTGGAATKIITPAQTLVSGAYQLEVISPDKKKSVIKVIVNK